MNVAVIGGGWAGLSAAVYLDRRGLRPVVFEASRTLGGRARGVASPRLDALVDNGQHILLGAYTETLQLLHDLGLSPSSRLRRNTLSLRYADNRCALNAWRLPAPLHLLGGILTARGLSAGERLGLIAICGRLRREGWKTTSGSTVGQWLERGGQSAHVVRHFWRPLCLAALNTPVERACAQLFAHVLRDSLGGGAGASDTLIPRFGLSDLWPERLPARIEIRRGQAVRHLAPAAGGVDIDGETFDAAVVATNAPSALRLLKNLPRSRQGDAYLALLARFEYLPIATLTLALDTAWGLPAPMLMLADHPEKCQFGQWLFDRSVFMDPAADGPDRSLAIVISDARAVQAHTHDRVAAGAIDQVKAQTHRFTPMPGVRGHELIIEKRATFAAVPNLERPESATPWARVWVAGDWTDTGYPAVLEGAVRSGKRAADLIAQAAGGGGRQGASVSAGREPWPARARSAPANPVD